jgi:hypothetical protein
MKKGSKILALTLFSLVLASFFFGVVSAAEEGQTNLLKSIGNIFSSSSSIFDAANQAAFSKILLITLLVLLIYSITVVIPFLSSSSDWIKWSFSIIVGMLGFIFVSAENIQYILSNYEALGIALTSIIPLVIIIAFTFQLRKNSPVTGAIVNPFIISLFIIYTLVKWFTLSWDSSKPTPELAWVYPLSAIFAVIWFAFNRKIIKKLITAELNAKAEEGETLIDEAVAGAKTLAGANRKLAKGAEKVAKGKI